jgi:micrococcal nuclease
VRKKSTSAILSLIFLAVFSLWQIFQERFVLGDSVEVENNSVKVARVIDGDTFEIETGEKVRLIGIDAPESVHPTKEDECYGETSSKVLKELIEGKSVYLEKDVSETDRYGRLLRYVYLDGQSINQYLVKEGFAFASSYPPDINKQELLTVLQTKARTEGKGLWSSCEVNDVDEINKLINDALF